MSDHPDSRYGDFWDRYVTETWPRIKERGRIPREDLEVWRVLNTTDSSFEWPGDEWGDRKAAEHVFNSALVDALGDEPAILCELGSGSGRYTVLALERYTRARVLAFDVSARFQEELLRRCAHWANEGRFEAILLDQDFRAMLRAIETRDLTGKIDAIFSFDAMVHVDLHTLVVYFVTAARVLKNGGVLAMNVADASSERGFLKLLFDAPSVYAQQGGQGGHFMWISRGIIESVLSGLGFEVCFAEGNGRDASFSARLIEPAESKRWLELAGASW